MKQQLDESMAIMGVSKHLLHSPGMLDSGKFEGPTNYDKFLKVNEHVRFAVMRRMSQCGVGIL